MLGRSVTYPYCSRTSLPKRVVYQYLVPIIPSLASNRQNAFLESVEEGINSRRKKELDASVDLGTACIRSGHVIHPAARPVVWKLFIFKKASYILSLQYSLNAIPKVSFETCQNHFEIERYYSRKSIIDNQVIY